METNGYSVNVTDRAATPEITESLLNSYNQLWLVQGDKDKKGCFSTAEINRLLAFRNAGNGLLLITGHESN